MILHCNPRLDDGSTRTALYAGELVLRSGLPAVSEFVDFAREQLATLFGPLDPETAHEHLTPEEVAELLGPWKPAFIHHEVAQRLVRRIVEEAGFAAQATYFDLPKPRTAFPQGHLTTGAAFAFPWHRDTWYSAPRQQVNWWLPVFSLESNNAMSFDPASFRVEVANNSESFDYYQHNSVRGAAASQVKIQRPGALAHIPQTEVVVLPAPGDVLIFSGAHLHRTTPNTSARTRFSIDFRTVDERDLIEGRGAPQVDARCTGTAIRDFRRVRDLAPFDEELVVSVFGQPPADAYLVFSPDG